MCVHHARGLDLVRRSATASILYLWKGDSPEIAGNAGAVQT